MFIRWSVDIEAAGSGERIMTHEEVLCLADAVAPVGGIATGIGTNGYGVQIVVFADTREEAIEKGTTRFRDAAREAGLPEFPIVRTEAISEDEE